MISTYVHRQWTFSVTAGGLGTEVALQAALCGLAGLLAAVMKQTGMASVDHAFTMLGAVIAITAAILLALSAWLSTTRPAAQLAFAIAMYGIFLLVKAGEPDPTADGLLARDLAMIGMAALCGLTLRGIDVIDRAWRASAPVGIAVLIGCAIVSLIPAATLTAPIQSAVAVSAGVITAAVGLTLVVFGNRGNQPLLRPTGLSLLTLSAQPSPAGSAFGLAAITMLLITAVLLVMRTGWLAQAKARLSAAEHKEPPRNSPSGGNGRLWRWHSRPTGDHRVAYHGR
ncbi:MAG: hypothetical protein ACRDRU_29540 [Pseudonocardiaceae bacterium]